MKIFCNQRQKRKYELVIEPTCSEKIYFLNNIGKFRINHSGNFRFSKLRVDLTDLNEDELFRNLGAIGYDNGIELYYPASQVKSRIRDSKINELITGF